jgi:hypothetical protein
VTHFDKEGRLRKIEHGKMFQHGHLSYKVKGFKHFSLEDEQSLCKSKKEEDQRSLIWF